ncbi:MAG TPA: hypothetical protein VFW45_06545 [Candidatus Polarisedimenticolia bacterium]|nr:hypothetical protein [Candidatus Polarisedimenticolia bacterium]
MAKIRKIDRVPGNGRRNYYLVDACFLVNNYIPIAIAPSVGDQKRLTACREWWDEIHAQLNANKARVYVPDVCIAEAYKVLAKKYYTERWFKSTASFRGARQKMVKDISLPARMLKAQARRVRFHDISTSRDIIIAVDRFYEMLMKQSIEVQLPDLILLATGKYLMDFFDIPKNRLHIVTLDRKLRRGTQKIQELPNAYDPTEASDSVGRIFR